MTLPRDPAFEAWRDKAADADILDIALSSKVRAQLLPGAKRPKAREHVGPCPHCGGVDRFAVNTSKQLFNCRGAVGGGVITMVMHACGVDYLAACEIINGEPPPAGGRKLTPAEVKQIEEQEAQREAEREAKADQRERENAQYREKERGNAFFRIWGKGIAPEATPIEEYHALRGLVIPPGISGVRLRASPRLAYWLTEGRGDNPELLHTGWAMLLPIVRGGKFSGVHCTYIDLGQPKGKARIVNPDNGKILDAKKVRGSQQGGHVVVVACPEPRRLVIGEGYEKVAAMWCALYESGRDLSSTAFWTSINLGNLGGKHAGTVRHPTRKTDKGKARMVAGPVPDLSEAGIEIPDSVEEIIILGDAGDRFLVECAVARAAARWARPDRSIKVAWCWPDADFDDVLRTEQPREAACARVVAAFDAAQPVGVVEAVDPAGEHPPAAPPRRRKARPKPDAPRERSDNSAANEDFVPESLASSQEGGGKDGPPPRGLDEYDIDDLNRMYAFVLLGSKAVIMQERLDAPIEDQKRILEIGSFERKFQNRKTYIRLANGNLKSMTLAKRWLEDRGRREYDGVEFFPDIDNAPGTPGYLNLWSGLAVKPARERDDRRYKTFRDHLLNNICSGNRDHFNWVFGFFAHIVQRPRERLGVALVMRGRMGTGKTKVGEIMGRLYPRHYFLVDDPRYVTGQFNAHMATCLLLQADEAVWAGDKAAEGRLKGLITSPIQQIEHKNVDPIRLANYVRLIMTSNEEWVVPAGKDERRFAVLDVDPRCAQNNAYFREMDEELDAGGIGALLADLLAFDLDSVNLWQIPRTDALLEQKMRSLNPIESWWLDRLMAGTTSRHSVHWRNVVAISRLFGDYWSHADRTGIRRKQDETVFGIAIAKLIPNLMRVRRTVEVDDQNGHPVEKRTWCYQLPSLSECRDEFDRIVGQSVRWPPVDDDGAERPNDSLNEPVF